MNSRETGDRPADVSQRRREVLEGLRQEGPVPHGLREEGIRDKDAILIAYFRNPLIGRRFRRNLQAAGIASYARRDGKKLRVEVKYADRERAWELLARQKATYPDVWPRRPRGDFDFTILGGFVGVTCVCMSMSFTPFRVWLALALFFGGIFIGLVADHFNRNYRYLGHLQFGILDCLRLTLAVALIVALLRLVQRYL